MGGFSLEVKTDEDVERFGKVMFHEDIATNLVHNTVRVRDNLKDIKGADYFCCILHNEDADIGVGAIKIYPHINKACIDVGILEKYRDKDAMQASKDGLEKFFDKFPGIELYSFVKKAHRPSLIFSKQAGLKIHQKIWGNYILRYKKC